MIVKIMVAIGIIATAFFIVSHPSLISDILTFLKDLGTSAKS